MSKDEVIGYTGRFGRESYWEFLQQSDWYDQTFYKYGDVRTTNRFMLVTPEPMLLVVVAYLLFVWLGPHVMAKREPFNLRALIVLYNFVLVGLSAYMSYEFFATAAGLGYSYACQGVDWTYSTDQLSMRLTRVSWLFYISKIIELADTVFYHHSTMIINWHGSQISPCWAIFLCWHDQLIHPRSHVCLLWPRCHWTTHAEVSLVEEIHDIIATDSVCVGGESHWVQQVCTL
jgi:hypothetical protein